MAILCSHCGKPLQKDDARFCNNCGTLIPSHPFSPQSLSQSSQQQPPQSGSMASGEPGTSPPAHSKPVSMSGIAGNPVPETGNGPVRPASRLENQPAPQHEQNMPRPSTRPDKDEPPAWMSRLGKNPISQSGLLEERPSNMKLPPLPALDAGTPNPSGTNVPGRGLFVGQRDGGAPARENASPPPSSSRTNSPQRELRVKVWDDGNAQTPVEQGKSAPKALPITPQPIVSAWKDVEVLPISVPGVVSGQANNAAPSQQTLPEMEGIENLPTSSLGAVSVEQAKSVVSSTQTPSETQDVDELPTRPLTAFPQEKPLARAELPSLEYEPQNATDDIEDLATLHLAAQAASVSPPQQKPEYVVVRDNTPAPGVISKSAAQMPSQPGFAPSDRSQPLSQPGFAPFDRSQPPSQPGFAPFDRSQTPTPVTPPTLVNNVIGTPAQSSPQFTPDAPPARRSRKWVPLVIALVVLVVLAAAGAGSWIVIAQPFAVASITVPLVSFQDQSLGVAVQYPHDWTAKIDRSKSVISFYDSGNTDRMNVQITNASTADLAQYLQQQAAQQSVTAAKAASALSFGGSTWQQLQGSVVLSGANYSEVFLASKHGTHLYTISQLAPQISYADEEKVTFSPMRATWQFLS